MFFRYYHISQLFAHSNEVQLECCCRAGGIDSLLRLVHVIDAFRDEVEYPVNIYYAFGDASLCDYEQHQYYQALDITTSGDLRSMYYDLLDFLNRSPLRSFVGDLVLTNKFIHLGLRTSTHKNFLHYEKRNS